MFDSKIESFLETVGGEYLADLREMHRLRKRETVEIKSGDIVLISDESRKRGFWKMGIVEEEIIGRDGIIRGAKVRVTGTGKPEHLNRPLQKLYPLELSVRNESDKREELTDINEGTKKKDYEKSAENSVEVRNPGRNAQGRAAARDARLRTKLMLEGGGCVGEYS